MNSAHSFTEGSNAYTDVIQGATFSDDRKYRYVLWRIWDVSLPFVMVIGLNPSTANESDQDPTIRNLCDLLSRSGYGGLYMVNLFGLVSSNPDDLRSCPDPVKDNDAHVASTALKCDDVIFAWGAFKQAQYRVKKVTSAFPDALCFGKTKHGHPIHPLAATVWRKSNCSKVRHGHPNAPPSAPGTDGRKATGFNPRPGQACRIGVSR